MDIEHVHDDVNYEQVAEHVFSVRERETLHALPTNQRQKAFYNCWTPKEAFIKATGIDRRAFAVRRRLHSNRR